ncbi:MAG: acyl-CoA dehydrogenase family protein [Myxococcales bacterium]|nr:acyl-CoA dehydrogenase family protein [Myxococcales bacterium]MCB9575605.1 acyl-CoA dehydrogenase family protein [Polyangiaceae bacterium]
MPRRIPTAQSLERDPRACATVPLLYIAWSDGLLTDDEIASVRKAMEGFDWIADDARQSVSAWLDPKAPPSPTELDKLLDVIRRHSADLSQSKRHTLANLGLELARLEHEKDDIDGLEAPEVERALLQVEKALGVVSEDAVRALLSPPPWPLSDTFDEPDAKFSSRRLAELIEGEHREHFNRIRSVIRGRELVPRFGLSLGEQRRVVRGWLRTLSEEGIGSVGLPTAPDSRGDQRALIASLEGLGMFDLDLAVKFGVQFGLFGGSVRGLGTDEQHARFLPDIARGRMLGGFAMTELGHGSNVRDIETVARYHPDQNAFVLRTPKESARKEWIGNAGEDGRFMTVFCQLEVDRRRHGVHALLVRIRHDDGTPVTGVRTEDAGPKMGLNGVDNGRLWFDDVVVPRDQLLGRFGRVDQHGNYQSDIASPNKRFFAMLSTLVGGRIGVGACANMAAKTGLATAIRYGALRRQFGSGSAPEVRILDYPEHQLRLFPRLAASIAIGFAAQALTRRVVDGREDRELEALAATFKALATRNAVDTIQSCRECCGGMGYLAANRIAKLRTDVDVFVTFEGDNTVLLQLVARSLLTRFRQQLSDDAVRTTLELLAHRARATLHHKNPIAARRTDREHLTDPQFFADAFGYREEALTVAAARRIKRRIDDGMTAFDAFNEVQDHLLALARAYGERFVVREVTAAVERATAPAERAQLERLAQLYCLTRVREDMAFFSENGYVEPRKARAIRKLVLTLCRELRPHAIALVEALQVPESCLAPIAFEHYFEHPALHNSI